MALAIANRYALALADVVSEPNSGLSPEQALEQLRAFGAALNDSADLRGVLLSPTVRPLDKRALTARLCERLECSEKIRNFVHVVVDHRRVALFDELVDAYRSWLDERRGVARVEVRTAHAIAADQQTALEKKFAALTGKAVEARYVVDEGVIGGSVVRVGSTVYDGSLRTKLQSLGRAMHAAG